MTSPGHDERVAAQIKRAELLWRLYGAWIDEAKHTPELTLYDAFAAGMAVQRTLTPEEDELLRARVTQKGEQ